MALDYPHLPILHVAQFSRDDVMAVCEISSGVLKGILDRKQVQLQSDHNPGSGRRRMFTGGDILKINSAVVSSSIGFPLRWAHILADRVMTRANGKLSGMTLESCNHFALAFYPDTAGEDWAFVPILDGIPASPLPIACQQIDVDRLIDETASKLTAIVNEEPVPSFAIPVFTQENPYSPENDFFRMWAKDDAGRDVFVGLSFEETQERIKLQQLWLEDRSQDDDGPMRVIISGEQEERLRMLDATHERHKRARDMGVSPDSLKNFPETE